MTIHMLKSKPEIEFQYGGLLLSETGSGFIPAVEWDISSKFGRPIDFHLLKQMPSLNLNPEVHFRLYDRHVENSIWCHNSTADRPITTKFGKHMQNDMPMTIHTSKSKPEIEFQYGGHPFSETGSSFISAVDWDILSKFGMERDFYLLKQMPSLNLKPWVDFRLYGRHLEKSMTSELRRRSSDFYEIWKTDVKWHADDNGNRKYNSSMAAVRFPKPEVVLSQPWIEKHRLFIAGGF